MLELTPPTQIPAFPRNFRELLFAPGARYVPAAQQALLAPGQVFQLAQPRWPIDSTAPSFYALVATVGFSALFLVILKDVSALINYEIRSRFYVEGNPVVSFGIALIALTMLLIAYENDIKKRSGYYSDSSDPRYVVALSLFAALVAVYWASKVFTTNPLPPHEQEKEARRRAGLPPVAETKVVQAKQNARQRKNQAKWEAQRKLAS